MESEVCGGGGVRPRNAPVNSALQKCWYCLPGGHVFLCSPRTSILFAAQERTFSFPS